MKIYVTIGEDGYINGVSSTPMTIGAEGESGEYELEVEEDHDVLDNMEAWKIDGGQLVSPPERLEELLAEEALQPPSTKEQLKAENKALSDRVDFLESVLEEMIFSIYE